jgi:hypothetical protein
VLAGVAKGLTNAEIGRKLFIGEATVKTHPLRVFAKLGVDDRTRAVLVAVERELLAGLGRPADLLPTWPPDLAFHLASTLSRR